MDSSDYASSDSDFSKDDDIDYNRFKNDDEEGGGMYEDDTPTIELSPVPMSKNSGNRFVALLWDKELDTEGRDALQLHHDRTQLTEDHVMFCRKRNLYTTDFNENSMVDILWSRPM